ncbi:MAG: hypothetical protein IPM69_00555 [Ignavibacteria bacterium]|nr:hypothetical protein [Ignavibacteria bacterium]
MFRSSDNGKNWKPVESEMDLYISTLAFSGTNLYATGRNKVYISKDLGESWISVSNGLPNKNVNSIGVVGTNIIAGIQNGGAYISLDSGNNWSAINAGFIDRTVYTFITVGNTIFTGTESGVYLSSDNGISWASSNIGISASIISFTVQGTNIYAGSRYNGEVYLSTNLGASWSKFKTSLTLQNIRSLFTIDSNVFVGTDSNLFVTSINSPGWIKVDSGLPKCRVYSLFKIGTNFIAGTDKDVMLSTDEGKSWNESNNGLSGTITMCFTQNGKISSQELVIMACSCQQMKG